MNRVCWSGMSTIRLDSDAMGLAFDEQTFALTAVFNHLTGERYDIVDEGFVLQFVSRDVTRAQGKVIRHDVKPDAMRVEIDCGDVAVTETWRLRGHFAELTLSVKAAREVDVLRVRPARWRMSRDAATAVRYEHLKCVTFFGRTNRGGYFLGVQWPFDDCRLDGDLFDLNYAMNMSADGFVTEPVYMGVYEGADDGGSPRAGESKAMRAMVAQVLGPPRVGFMPIALGWHSEMTRDAYSDEDFAADLNALELIADCGIDWLADSRAWAGHCLQLSDLVDVDDFKMDDRPRRMLARAAELGIHVLLWSSMNHAHPWLRDTAKPFRTDKPEWLMIPGARVHHERRHGSDVIETRNVEVNCVANQPFRDWLYALHDKVLTEGGFDGWTMDGHFIGLSYSGRFNVPARCPSDAHDHLPGDAQYACMQALRDLVKRIRAARPNLVMQQYRPVMDLGCWAWHDTDGVFTVHESAALEPLPGLADQSPNMILGDRTRTWARVRMHHHFMPHHMDLSQLFPMPLLEGYRQARAWSNVDLVYHLLSAFSSSPKMLMYLPTRSGVDDEGRATLRHWFNWARKNERYLMVRDDLPDWPGAGVVDGSMHLIDGEGFVFLFNPNPDEWSITLPLDEASRVTAVYPETLTSNAPQRWTLPARSAALLRVEH